MVGKWEGYRGIDWESGISRGKLLYVGWINNYLIYRISKHPIYNIKLLCIGWIGPMNVLLHYIGLLGHIYYICH